MKEVHAKAELSIRENVEKTNFELKQTRLAMVEEAEALKLRLEQEAAAKLEAEL